MHTHNLLSLLATVLTVTALPQPHADAAIKPKDPAPTLDEFLSSPMTFEKRQSNTSTSSTSLPDATVQLCTQPDFKGECTNATWSVNQCIDLRGYAGVTESFLPGEGFECLLMQGECDATEPYAEVGDSDKAEGSDLTTYDWIKDFTSYMCFTEIEALQRFVRVSRLRVAKAKVQQS